MSAEITTPEATETVNVGRAETATPEGRVERTREPNRSANLERLRATVVVLSEERARIVRDLETLP